MKLINKLTDCCIAIIYRFFHSEYKEKEMKLSLLSPGVNSKALIFSYYRKKCISVAKILFAFVIVLSLVIIWKTTSSNVIDDYYIARNNYGDGAHDVTLHVNSDSLEYDDITLNINERKYTKSEARDAMDYIYSSISSTILGDNSSLNHVCFDLNLPTALSSYPFSIRWESSDYRVIDEKGHINCTDNNESGISVTLRMILIYEDIEQTYDFPIVVFTPPLTDEDMNIAALKQAIDAADSSTQYDEYQQLPNTIEGHDITWSDSSDSSILLLLIIFFIAIIAIWKGIDKDLNNRIKNRNESMELDYCELINQIKLLLSSGMTLRNSFEKIAVDYSRSLSEGHKPKCVYEEILFFLKKMQDGMSETQCYEIFGKRCNLPCYKKLSSLLIQNLKKGNGGLINALQNESEFAFASRMAKAKRLGEEAQTKLLFPMIIMLSVVMIIIMIPAYLSFSGL